MNIAATANPGSRQEELGQFPTAKPEADFMASMFGPRGSANSSTPGGRWGALVKQAAIVEWAEGLMATCRALEAEIEHARTHAAHLLQAVLKEAFAPAST